MKPLLFKSYMNGIYVEEKWFKLSVLEYGSNQCLIPKMPDAKMPDAKMPDTKIPDTKMPDTKMPGTKFISFMLVQFTAP